MSQGIEIERRLAAVLAADVAGFSRLTEADEVGTMRMLAAQRAILDSAIARHRGRIANTAGDSVLAEFPSAVNAVQCAVEAQQALHDAADDVPEGRRLLFRIGIHVGDVMVRDGDLLGTGVNTAARLEALADAGGIVISAAAHEQVKKILPLTYTDLGQQNVKNIEEPVRAFAIGASAAGPSPSLREPGKPAPLPDKPSIAVLPFQNMSGDPEQDYFADGMVEDIITALSRFTSLSVIARNSSFAFKGKAVDVSDVGRQLNARYVLEGSVRRAGNRVRITGQLIEAATNSHLWADKFEGAFDDVFELQDRIASAIVGVVEPTIQHKVLEHVSRGQTEDMNAYDRYLKAWAKYNAWTREANAQGDEVIDAAIALDPDFAGALALKAQLRVQRVMQGWSADPARDIAEGIALANRALETGRNDAVALSNIAFLRAFCVGDVANAVTYANRALALNPNLYIALEINAWVHLLAGHAELAIRHCRRARELNPLGTLKSPEALGQFLLGNDADALALASQMVVEFPKSTTALRFAAIIKVSLGQREEARRIVRKILEIKPDSSTEPGPWIAYQQNPQYKQRFMDALRMMGELGLRQA